MEQTLRALFEACKMGSWDDRPDRIIAEFTKACLKYKAAEHLRDKIIQEHYPWYGVQETHTDIPGWKSQQLKTADEQKLTKRQVERRFLKAKMQYYVDSNPTEEFSVKVLCALFPERKADTITALVKELWQEGLVKGRIEVRTLSRKPKKSTCSYVITSLANPSTNYYTEFPKDNLWFKKKKIGTRQEEVRN